MARSRGTVGENWPRRDMASDCAITRATRRVHSSRSESTAVSRFTASTNRVTSAASAAFSSTGSASYFSCAGRHHGAAIFEARGRMASMRALTSMFPAVSSSRRSRPGSMLASRPGTSAP